MFSFYYNNKKTVNINMIEQRSNIIQSQRSSHISNSNLPINPNVNFAQIENNNGVQTIEQIQGGYRTTQLTPTGFVQHEKVQFKENLINGGQNLIKVENTKQFVANKNIVTPVTAPVLTTPVVPVMRTIPVLPVVPVVPVVQTMPLMSSNINNIVTDQSHLYNPNHVYGTSMIGKGLSKKQMRHKLGQKMSYSNFVPAAQFIQM